MVYTKLSLAQRETNWTHEPTFFAKDNGMSFVTACQNYWREIRPTNGGQERHVVGYDKKTSRKSATCNIKGWHPSRSGDPEFEPPHKDWLPNTDFCCCLHFLFWNCKYRLRDVLAGVTSRLRSWPLYNLKQLTEQVMGRYWVFLAPWHRPWSITA